MPLFYKIWLYFKQMLVFFLYVHAVQTEARERITCTPWTSRLPKMAQPDLDYIGKSDAYVTMLLGVSPNKDLIDD